VHHAQGTRLGRQSLLHGGAKIGHRARLSKVLHFSESCDDANHDFAICSNPTSKNMSMMTLYCAEVVFWPGTILTAQYENRFPKETGASDIQHAKGFTSGSHVTKSEIFFPVKFVWTNSSGGFVVVVADCIVVVVDDVKIEGGATVVVVLFAGVGHCLDTLKTEQFLYGIDPNEEMLIDSELGRLPP
jgi:hypothetical protein